MRMRSELINGFMITVSGGGRSIARMQRPAIFDLDLVVRGLYRGRCRIPISTPGRHDRERNLSDGAFGVEGERISNATVCRDGKRCVWACCHATLFPSSRALAPVSVVARTVPAPIMNPAVRPFLTPSRSTVPAQALRRVPAVGNAPFQYPFGGSVRPVLITMSVLAC